MKDIYSSYYCSQWICRPVLFLILSVFTAPFTSLNAQQVRKAFRFEPDFVRIQPALASAPPERDAAARRVATVIELPDPRGVRLPLQVWETSMLTPDFAAQYPDFKTYSLTDPESGVYRGQLFASRFGLQALIFSAEGTFMVHPLDRSNPTVHEAYFEENAQVNCSGDFHPDDFKKAERQTPEAIMAPNGTIIRTYRLAIVTTGEYYQGNGNTAPLANAAVVTDVNNLSAIYKRELAVNFTLLTPVHYTNPATDPFFPDESNGIERSFQTAAVVGANFAQSAYDVGHTFHKGGGGGYAYFFTVCDNNALPDPDGAGLVYTTGGYAKSLGWSGDAVNQTLGFARLVAHEIGHMFDARHTFNGSGGNCTPPPNGNIDPGSSFEIGSGTTIMSYNGSCGAGQNVPYNGTSDDYFHAKNLEQILSFISIGGTCATTAPSGNQPPAVSANPCGGSLTIPKLTPFTLTGSGSDPDGHIVFYNWEQIDEDGANAPTQGYIGTTAGNSSIAPLFRSYPATTSPARTFPALSFILNNANIADFEALPNVARTINFRLQASDNQTFGAINNSDVAVTVSGTTGPLTVTAPNGGENWASGNQTVTWSVNGTNTLSANARIVMSLDGGQSFPIVLAASTPNDGSQTVSIPALAASTTARIKVECVINSCLTFFDVSNANFIFTSACAALPTAICPTTPQTFPQGDPGLNLSFKVQKPAVVTSKTFTLSSGDPTMNQVRWNASETACETPGGTQPNYQIFKFVVSESGSYLVSSGLGNYRAVHLFANSFNPNGGCGNFVASSVVKDTFFSYLKTNPVLTACTEYYLVITNQYGGNNTTITFSGPGTVREVFTPVTNYSYTFAAVNTAGDQVAAVSATASFTALGPGNYQIYGLHYKSSGATPPANADPNTFVGQTIAQLLGAGICFNASSTSRPITVTATSPQFVINEVDYHQPVADDAEFIELKNISASAVNLSGWTLELVDGNAGGATVYQTITLPSVSVPAGGYYVVCGNSAKVPNCNLVVAPSTNLIQNGAPDAIGLRQNGTLRDAVSYEGNAGAPYTESAGVSPGDTGVGVRHSIARFPDGTDSNNNSTNFSSDVCGTPGAANINSTLSIQSVITAVSCNGGSNGSVALTVSGGIAPYTYLWSNGQTTATATGLAAGTYTATVTSTYGCAASLTASVTQPAALSIGKTITNVSCPNGSNGSVALSVTGGTTPYAYLWSNGQTTATATNLIAGTYTATVTDNKGCVATTTASVTQPTPFSIGRTITNISCPGGANGAVALNVTGATAPYTYLWSNGQTTAAATGLVAGIYTATVTDFKGCVGTSSATVTQPAALSITKTITNVSTPGGSDGAVALSVTGGTTPYVYLWSNGQTTATATGLAAGTYTVTVTDNKGCTATTSATVTQPTGGMPTLLVVSANTIRIKYFNAIAPATATAANLPIWGDETGLRTGTYSVSADTVTFVANTAFRVGELIHITSKSSLQFTGGGATTPFSWVRQSVVTNPAAAVFDTTGTGIILPPAAYSTNASSNAAMADVNRDGRQDLVFRYHASYGAATNILVYFRNVDGAFAAPATYTNSESHSGLVGTPDVNNDGYPDIVLFHNFPSAIQVRLNNGSGSFGAAALYPVNNYCNGAKVYDMDNDGDLDIIAFVGISTLSANTISILKNNGNGTFAAQISTNTSVFGASCQPADLDNDGDMDLAYTSSNAFGSSRVFRVYRNDGTGALTLNNSEANNLSKQVMSAFDYNADGNVDLITFVPNGEIYLNNAGINYTLATPAAFTSDYAYSLAGDLDGDGDLDIFNANSSNGTDWNTLPLKFFRNNGSGTFATTTTALVLPVLWTTDLSDYDSDGDLDHIYLNPATGEIKVLLNGNMPTCTNLATPAPGAMNVPVTAALSWPAINLVTGYRLSMGTTPGGTQILNNYDVGNVTMYDPPGDLPYSATIYVTITPYNTAGNATGCTEESFETEVSLLLTTGGIPAATLVTDHLIGGGCFEVSNITSTGVASSRGTFSGGAPNINIASGVVLCTGNVSVLTGPNNANNASGNTAGFNLNSTDDPDLASVSAGNQFDLSRIEFDFKPTTSAVQFEFVFGSEEYCEYVLTQFNDVFGIFISGPGINGTQNIALLPNTNTPVTINNVNAIVNPTYYVNNNNWPGTNCSGLPMAAPESCQLDGWTEVLTATATVVPCATYHIKLAIADIVDGAFASAVFVRMHTLTNSGYANVTAVYPAGQQHVAEGCNDGFIKFTRTGGKLDMPLPVPFSIGGSAMSGIDYEPLPGTATIPAGATETLIPVTAYADLLLETQETITITLDAPCSCATATTNFLINDKPPLFIDMDDEVQCGVSSITLAPDILSTGLPPLTYAWSTGATTASIAITTPGTSIFTVTVTDDCGSTATAEASVTLVPLPNNFSIVQTITPVACAGGANGAAALNVTGGAAPYTYLWNNGQMAATATNLIANTYTVTLTDSQGCSATVSATVTQPAVLSIAKTIANVSCLNGSNGAVALSVTGGTTPYAYLWNNGQTTATATGLIAGTYTVTTTDAHGCTATTTAMVTQPATNPPPADLCQNACVYCTINGYAGSTAGYTGQYPPGFCGTVENEQWMGFVADAPAVTITVTPSGCQLGHGVQLALYSNCDSTALACAYGQNGGGNIPVSITANVTPGEPYFLLIDGWAGDVCNFTLSVTPEPAEAPVQAAVKVFLQGPYVAAAQLMHDSLRTNGLIPLQEPYTGLSNFTHSGGGGGEQTTAAVLAVTGANAIVDWVFLELRSAANPALVLATRSAFVQRDGDVVDVNGVSPVVFDLPAGASYFLVVRHRNHLGVQLGEAMFYPECAVTATDFRNLPPGGFYAFNGLNPAQRTISGIFALWAGNGRTDFQLKYNGSNNDRNAVLSVVGLSTPNAIVPGYKVEDYNMDGLVKYNGSANDRNVLLGNVGISTPSAILNDQIAR